MVDDLDGDAAGSGLRKGTGDVAVEGCPGVGVDLGLQGGLEGFIRVVRSQEIGVTDEEAFFIVIRVLEGNFSCS